MLLPKNEIFKCCQTFVKVSKTMLFKERLLIKCCQFAAQIIAILNKLGEIYLGIFIFVATFGEFHVFVTLAIYFYISN